MKHPFDADTVKLLRIPFSYLLMPIYFMALSQAPNPDFVKAFGIFIILHLFIYPASNGYNSYMDRDEGSIGGLKNPPMPTQNLFYATLILDFAGIILSTLINEEFLVAVILYILASRAYSYKGIRLKKYAFLGYFIVIVFQGFVTYCMVILGSTQLEFREFYASDQYWIAVASTLMIGGVYPLTQIYQHEDDKNRGDETLSSKLGYRGTFVISGVMFLACTVFLFRYFSVVDFVTFQLFLIPVVFFFINWAYKVVKDAGMANFENTMKMNIIAATCMNVCFLFLTIYKYFVILY
ncbi:MAG: UbiA family prenyltransferase [Cytophagales bacterium]|nr:UbiA family prenyltransferase [Cytophagales bacterium]